MLFRTDFYSNTPSPVQHLVFQRITSEILHTFSGSDFGIKPMKNYLAKLSGISEGFGLWTENNEPAGHVQRRKNAAIPSENYRRSTV